MRRPAPSSALAAISCVGIFVSSAILGEVHTLDPNQPSVIRFDVQDARMVRVLIHKVARHRAPCMDELEIYGPAGKENLARLPSAKATASSVYPNNPLHQIEHLNDGQYGNERSWIASPEDREPWARIDLAKAAPVNRIVFSRDRLGRYDDRMPIDVEVQLSTDGKTWKTAKRVRSDDQARPTVPAVTTPKEKQMWEKLLDGKLGFRGILLVERYPLEISHVYVYHVEGYCPGGGLYIYSPDEKGGRLKRIFDSSAGMITSAVLSFDGEEIVFAWRRGGHVRSNPFRLQKDISRYADERANYQVFRINVDGTELTQLTHGTHNNLDPCWLPDGGIAFISDRKPAYAYCYVVTSPVLYRMERDGSRQKRISASYLMDFTPAVLNDGRLIYTRWEYVDRGVCPIQSLWTINPDGTCLSGFYGNRVLEPGTFMDAGPIPGSHRILATATNHNGPCRGAIVEIDPRKGSNAPQAVRNLTPEVDIYAHRDGGGSYGNGMLLTGAKLPYLKPFAVDRNHFLVSKAGTIQLRDFDANAVSLLSGRGGLGFYCPQPVRSTVRPPLATGTLADEEIESSEDGTPSGAWATVFLQDVYNGLEPHVRRGDVKKIAVVEEVGKGTHTPHWNPCPMTGKGMRRTVCFGYQSPVVSCGATFAPKKVWGFADVNQDGSAAFKVPAEVPIDFLALDAEGRAVQRMRTFTHFMSGEVQGCVGCHANRNSAVPRGGNDPAMRGDVQELEVPEWGVTGFSYPDVVQPVFDRHCGQCHNPLVESGGVDLSGEKTDLFNVSYDVLCRTGTLAAWHWDRQWTPEGPSHDTLRGRSPYVEWIWGINGSGHNILQIAPRRWGSPASRLAEIIHSGHPDENGEARIDMPPAERRKVYLWMDLNVPYYGTASSNHKYQMGGRRMYPRELDNTLKEVASRRCAGCHREKLPRDFYTRILKPENNRVLLAPLAKSAGGTERCGKAVFASKDDPDYQKIVDTFKPVHELLKKRPRADMDQQPIDDYAVPYALRSSSN